MPSAREGLASVNLGTTKALGLKLVQQGRFENLCEACRAGLRRLDEDNLIMERLITLGEERLASGIDDDFDIDAFIDEAAQSA